MTISWDDADGISRVAGMPEGHDAFVLAALAQTAGARGVLHVADDTGRMERLCRQLRFVAPDLEVRLFPNWDCLPYDRVSPTPRVGGRRVDTLHRLGLRSLPAARRRPLIVVTTGAAIQQRILRPAACTRRALQITGEAPTDLSGLEIWLRRHGYAAVPALRDPGDFRIDDDAIEVLSSDGGGAIRIDRNGTLERRRPDETRTPATEALLLPAVEVVLDDAAVVRFTAGYLAAFGAEAAQDPLLTAVAAGRRVPGMEYWLPLFEPDLTGLADLLPDALVTCDEDAEAMGTHYRGQVAHAFADRQTRQRAIGRTTVPVNRPLPPERLLVEENPLGAGVSGRPVIRFQGAPPSGDGGALDGPGTADGGGRPLAPPIAGRSPRERLAGLAEAAPRVVVVVDDPGHRGATVRRLNREGVAGAVPVADWPAVEQLAPAVVAVAVFDLEDGFVAPALVAIPAAELFGAGETSGRRQRFSRLVTDLAREAADLAPGRVVVDRDHGIALCDGLETVESAGRPHACLRLRFRGDAKLYVPVENLDLVSPFGLAAGAVTLDSLNSEAWRMRTRQVAEALLETARSLVQAQAERDVRRTGPIRPDRAALRRFAGTFPHDLTPDQRTAIQSVLRDLAAGRLMDRLVCADVGFGKTEIALRAAFAVIEGGRQVAVMAPTTPLCRQHRHEFQTRFDGFGVAVAELSRGVAPADLRDVKSRLQSGAVRLVVGTQALLGGDVAFADLGLIVVDEEQRLGVRQKEQLKALGEAAHILTLTATPIPRTLQMALAGLRDLSVIATPPPDRRPVRSRSGRYDPGQVGAALAVERDRGGQSFYVCPRVDDLPIVRARLDALAPGAVVIEAHGRLTPAALEAAVTAFWEGAADILLCTNIVENGLNLPNANTMIVHRADRFGLAQLHQLRGRVGRSAIQGACWFTVEDDQAVTEEARRRLTLIAETDHLGAGFDLAAHDLGLRGAGNLLGTEQSGRFEGIGIALYEEMLARAITAVRTGAGSVEPAPVPRVALAEPAAVPETYIPDIALRLAVYRRLACIADGDERDDFAATLSASIGPPPVELETLLEVGHLKDQCRAAGVATLDIGPNGALIGFAADCPPAPQEVDRWSRTLPNAKRRDDGRLFLGANGDPSPVFRDRVRAALGFLIAEGAGRRPIATDDDAD